MVWRRALVRVAKEHSLRLYPNAESIQAFSKTDLLSALEDAEGIIFIVAHSSGTHIVFSSGDRIEITPADIAKLRFRRNPFIFLRVCFGADDGFASAFMKAGAMAVWANRGVMEAPFAVRQLASFLGEIRGGLSIYAAIQRVRVSDGRAMEDTVLVTHVSKRGSSNRRYEVRYR